MKKHQTNLQFSNGLEAEKRDPSGQILLNWNISQATRNSGKRRKKVELWCLNRDE